jgi:hypothetical protein
LFFGCNIRMQVLRECHGHLRAVGTYRNCTCYGRDWGRSRSDVCPNNRQAACEQSTTDRGNPKLSTTATEGHAPLSRNTEQYLVVICRDHS